MVTEYALGYILAKKRIQYLLANTHSGTESCPSKHFIFCLFASEDISDAAKRLLSRTSQKSSIKSSTLSLANSLDRFRT